MNNQELFDKVVTALRAQRVRSQDPETLTCEYRGPNGLKCAAGHVLPDDRYHPIFEGRGAHEDDIRKVFDELGYDNELLCELQGVHDYYIDLEGNRAFYKRTNDVKLECYESEQGKTWEDGFKKVAKDFGLKYTV